MMRYYPHGNGSRPSDALAIGRIVYIQDNVRPFAPIDYPVRANPWMIVGFHNRDCMGRRLRGGHLLTVRSLRDGRSGLVADWIVKRCLEFQKAGAA